MPFAHIASAQLPTAHGPFEIHSFAADPATGRAPEDHVALSLNLPADPDTPVLVRLHSECLTGDAFASLRCDCGPQLNSTLAMIQQAGQGVDRIDVGSRLLRDPSEFHDRGDQGLELQWTALFDILQHGGLVLTHRLRTGDAFFQADLELHAKRLPDGLCFPHHGRRQFACRRQHQYAYRVARG